MKKAIIYTLLMCLIFFNVESQIIENPKYICKTCGSFDLNKITFKENIDSLTSKTEVTITAKINKYNKESKLEELSNQDTIKAYEYRLENQFDENLFNYNNNFFFNGISFLVNSEKQIVAFSSHTFYDKDLKKLNDFILFLQQKNKNMKMNYLYGNLIVYQWDTPSYYIQLIRDKEKKSVSKTYYVLLNIYNKSKLSKEVKESIERDPSFVIFNEKHFKK